MLKGGYCGKIMRIDLSKQTYTEEPVSLEMAQNFIGGAGFGVKYLFDEVPADCDPLSEANKLIFAVGPLCGTSTPCASRLVVTAKSPLTGAVGMGLSGGYFPAELKFAGYDALIIEGKSENPVYLVIKDGKVSFRSAEKLQGTKTIDCEQIIKDDLNDQNFRVACIGPAGENLSKLACIINERRAVGRKGLGAVMGSKNLKAIAVRGLTPVPVANEEAFKEARSRMLTSMKESPVVYSEFSKHGTPMVVEGTWAIGIFPTNNYLTTGEWAPVETLGIAANAAQKVGSERCYTCPVGCSQLKVVKKGPYAGDMSVPEFETMYSMGGITGNGNLDSVIAADRLCDELGLDAMSAGVAIGFAMELFEKGILTTEDTEGVELKFGNDMAMIDTIVKMAYRDGLGALLADGVRVAAEKIGKDSSKYAMHVKGLELPGYDVRGAKGHGLGFATAYTGADHNRSYAFQEIFGIPVPEAVDRFATEGKGRLTKWNQDVRAVTCDCAPMCAFMLDMAVPAVALQNTADLVSSVSGLSFTPEEVQKVGERLNNLARAFNALAGLTREDDTLPERIMTEPIKAGASKGHFISRDDLNQMLDEYYAVRGWSAKGIPSKEKLMELGLDDVLAKLEAKGLMA